MQKIWYPASNTKPFDRDFLLKLANTKSQRSSKSKDSNPKSSIPAKSRKSSHSLKSPSSSKSSKSSNNSKSSGKILLEKQKASILTSQAEGKLEKQIR